MDTADRATPVEKHLTTQELADRVGVPLATLYYWRAYKKGPRAMRIGKYVRYRMEDVLAWEQSQLEPLRSA
jgi:predicted DNA-binding transcriptional regulator AlpA